jgi:hypothetical protein
MALHPDAERAHRGSLRKLLSECAVQDGIGLVSIVKPLLDLIDQIRKNKAVGDSVRQHDLFAFIYTTTDNALERSVPEKEKRTGTLAGLLGDSGIKEIIDTIIDFLKSLPRTYKAYVELPGLNELSIDECKIAAGITLINSASNPKYSFLKDKRAVPRGTFADMLRLTNSSDSASRAMWLELECLGYYTIELTSTVSTSIVSRCKQVGVLSQAVGVTRYDSSTRWQIGEAVEPANVYVLDSGGLEQQPLQLPLPMSKILVDLQLTQTSRLSRPALPGALAFVTGKAVDEYGRVPLTPAQQLELISARFKPIGECIEKDHTDILTAAEWAFDADAEDNETLSYLYCSIGLEAVLGSSNERVRESLSDRLSYLIGISRSDRTSIQEKFKEYYETRSNIVHGKQPRLKDEQRVLKNYGRILLNRALTRELGQI